MTVRENLEMGARRSKGAQQDRPRVRKRVVTSSPGVGRVAARSVSGGERPRLAMAMARVEPKVLLLDELRGCRRWRDVLFEKSWGQQIGVAIALVEQTSART